MKNIAIILARSGSKRIKDKNIKLVAGRPLLSYPIECAKQSNLVDKVVLSTDSKYYQSFAQSYGVQTVLRGDDISVDNSKSEEALLYTLLALEKQGEIFDNVVMMQPSNPIVNPADIDAGLKLIEDEDSASVVTYTDFKGFFVDDEDILTRPMSQDKQTRKLESGAFWITKVSELKANNNRICNPISYLKLDNLAAIDIDTQQELEIAESILEKRNRIQAKSYYKIREYKGDYKSYYADNIDPDGIVRDNTSAAEMQHKNLVAKDEIDYINQLAKDGVHRKILDLGCGTGSMSACFDDCYEKYGLEIPDSITQSVKDFFDRDKLHIGFLDKEAFSDGFFDVVFCFHVVEHVPSPIEFIENISRILKTHGKLVISCPNFDGAMARRFGDNFRMLHDQTHCSLFGNQGLSDLLSDHGFQVEYTDYPFFDTEYFTMNNLERTFDTNKVSPPFYGNIMSVYATKK